MAIFKEIRQEDGVVTNYHRILFIQSTINRQTSIAVLSYVDSVARNSERTNASTPPYQKSITYEIDYIEGMTVEDAYNYLKTLPQFEGATDT